MLGNFSYCLQFAGFIAAEALMMRSCLIGGSLSFVVYALVQPKKLWIPAIWESTFASIHTYKIYELMCGDKISLSADEMRLYGLMFGHHHLDPHAFKRLVDIGQWVNHKPGEVLTTEGQHVSKVRLLVSGDVTIHIDNELVYKMDTPGHFIGEMALMEKFIHLHDDDEGSASGDYNKASATARTTSDIVCFEWATDELLDYLDKDQDSGALIKAFFEDVMVKIHSLGESNAAMTRWKRLRRSSTNVASGSSVPAKSAPPSEI